MGQPKRREGQREREREYWGLSCPLPVDYNTKWHLTTEIYLANSSPETFTEITIAKLACLTGQAETERQQQETRSSRTVADCPCHLSALCPLCALTPSHLAYQCQTQTISVLSLGRIASHQLAGFMQVQGDTIDACTTLI